MLLLHQLLDPKYGMIREGLWISLKFYFYIYILLNEKKIRTLCIKFFKIFFSCPPHSVFSKFPCASRGGLRLAVKCKLEEL